MQSGGRATQAFQIDMFEAEIKTKEAIVCEGYAAGAKQIMTIRLLKLLMISSLIAFIYTDLHAADLTDDPLPTVQENLATHKAVLVDVREPGEWKEGHVEGAISLPLSTLKKGVDTSKLEHQLPKDKIVYTHCVMGVRALKAAKILEKLGYNVRPLKAGYEDMVKAGFEKAAN
ncbi:MAG TPA: rhodanese-like domain-containing protein [Candidatus Udaeobacter sp.]|jgi:rhodanese-related sulfurtransferase